MNTAEMLNTLPDLLQKQLGVDVDKIVPEASFVDDLGADSLDMVELVMLLEEEFDIEISDDNAEKITTVGECGDLLARLINERGEG